MRWLFAAPVSARCSSILGFLGGIVAAVLTMNDNLSGFNGMIYAGGMASIYDIIFCGAGILTVLLARDYLARLGARSTSSIRCW